MKEVDQKAAALVDSGRLIEAGWEGFRQQCVPPTAGAAQIRDMRNAFFGGALHLFSALTGATLLDPDEEPTERDIARMRLIQQELELFGKSLGALPPNRRPA